MARTDAIHTKGDFRPARNRKLEFSSRKRSRISEAGQAGFEIARQVLRFQQDAVQNSFAQSEHYRL